MRVQFVLDYRSPYSYLANTQVRTLDAEIDYQPIDILAVMKQVNNQPSPMCPPKARYAGVDTARWAKHYGVPYSPNRALLGALRQEQFKNALLSRLGIAAQELGVFPQLHDALFRAVWAGSDDLATSEGRALFLANHALPAELWEVAESPDVGARQAANNDRAATSGVFGVPTFFVDDEMFFGNDRLAFVKTRLESSKARAVQ